MAVHIIGDKFDSMTDISFSKMCPANIIYVGY